MHMTTIEINGIPTDIPAGAIAYKYADPIEGACWLYTEDDVRDVEREDPSLIVRVELTTDNGACVAVTAEGVYVYGNVDEAHDPDWPPLLSLMFDGSAH